MMNLKSIQILTVISLYLLASITHKDGQVNALECYICQIQENNQDKCVQTVKTCDLDQDQCLSEVRWGSSPSWAPTGKKQYYISKRCATRLECNDAIADKQGKCERIWFNDWNCTSCCSGDKCNYYVTLDGNYLAPTNSLLLAAGCLLTLFINNYICNYNHSY